MPDAAGDRDDLAALDDAIRVLRAERTGVLAFNDHAATLKFVTDPGAGHIVAPVTLVLLEALEAVLFVPEETDDALQLLLTPEAINGDSHPAADRWRIHHGAPHETHWARFHIEGARRGAMIFDGDAFMTPCPLLAAEPALCRRLNHDKASLIRLCRLNLSADIEDPVCVAVDPDGLHIRARFGVVRVAFDRRAASPDDAAAMIDAMLRP